MRDNIAVSDIKEWLEHWKDTHAWEYIQQLDDCAIKRVNNAILNEVSQAFEDMIRDLADR